MTSDRPIVIAHRGASGYRPEHTLAAYELAIDQGADFIEPDLVATKDGVLVARHENAIAILEPLVEATTDVMSHSEFAGREKTKVIDGTAVTGWFTEDFTLEELKRLRAIERMPRLRPQNTVYDRRSDVPTLQEIIDLAQRKSRELGRRIGLYPETKHPSYFQSIGLALEEPLLDLLGGFDGPVFIQSFEASNLRMLRSMTELPLVRLLNTPETLEEIADYAAAIGPHKDLVIPRDESGNLTSPTTLVEEAHARGLLVHAWTFRSENLFLPAGCRRGDAAGLGDFAAEYEQFFAAGVDGVFSDYPDHAVAARDRYQE